MTNNLPLGHPGRSVHWNQVKQLAQDGELMAVILDYIALFHPVAWEAAVERMAEVDAALKSQLHRDPHG